MHMSGEVDRSSRVERVEKSVGVICDKRIPARVKGTVYKRVVRPAVMHGLETVALTKTGRACWDLFICEANIS